MSKTQTIEFTFSPLNISTLITYFVFTRIKTIFWVAKKGLNLELQTYTAGTVPICDGHIATCFIWSERKLFLVSTTLFGIDHPYSDLNNAGPESPFGLKSPWTFFLVRSYMIPVGIKISQSKLYLWAKTYDVLQRFLWKNYEL